VQTNAPPPGSKRTASICTHIIDFHHLIIFLSLRAWDFLQYISIVHSKQSECDLLFGLSIDISVSTALVSLSSDDLVVVLTKVHAITGPGVKVCLHVDGSSSAKTLTDRPVLLEGAGTVDGWLVGASRNHDVVVGTIGIEATLVLGTAAGVVGSEVLNDIVLDEWVAGPSVDGEVSVALWLEGTTIVDGSAISWVPSLASVG
jgi:hypothetical protein